MAALQTLHPCSQGMKHLKLGWDEFCSSKKIGRLKGVLVSAPEIMLRETQHRPSKKSSTSSSQLPKETFQTNSTTPDENMTNDIQGCSRVITRPAGQFRMFSHSRGSETGRVRRRSKPHGSGGVRSGTSGRVRRFSSVTGPVASPRPDPARKNQPDP